MRKLITILLLQVVAINFLFAQATLQNKPIDTVAGKCFQSATTDGKVFPIAIDLGSTNITSNQFSISCWIKPNGLQRASSQLITYAEEGSIYNGLGLVFKQGNAPTLELAFTNGSDEWSSGLSLESDAWNFVVLVSSSRTGVTIYVNGVPALNAKVRPGDLSQGSFWLTKENNFQLGGYNGAVDEIKFYNYPVSQAEIREKMHLIQKSPVESGLVKYFQFNQYDFDTPYVPDLMSDYEVGVKAQCIVASTAPVATGTVFRNPDVSTAGVYDFPGTGIQFSLKSGATYPNGEVVAFQLNAGPDQDPGTLPLVPRSKYFIIHNYGSNKTFTAPDSILFRGLDIQEPVYRQTDLRLYKRASGASGATWGNELSRSTGFLFSPGNSAVVFAAGNNATSFGQFALSALPLKADTVAGKCFQGIKANPVAIPLGNINVNSNQFSISCWIKPDGLQRIYAPLITYKDGLGLIFSGGSDAPNLELAYTNGQSSWNSGLLAESGAWNFVVLTCSPTGGKIYVNGVPSANTFTVTARDLSQDNFWLTREITTWYSTGYNGAIDEIKFYNYALSQAEVREKMHLIQKYPATESGLLKYFQFNQYNSSTGKVPDVMSAFETTIASANITASTAPVATGKVYRYPNVNAEGLYYFPGAEVLFSLKSSATYPNGEVVAFQLNAAPDQTPGTLPLVPRSKYFIINNFGINKTFTAPEWIAFNGLDLPPTYGATDFRLFKRASGASGATWGNELSRSTTFNYGPGNSNVVFGGNNITTFGQFALTAPAPAATRLSVTTPGEKAIQNGKAIATAEFYPNPNKGWGYLNISSPHDNAHVNVYVQDINGNTVYKSSEQLNGSNKTMTMLNLNALPSGVYILQVRFNTGEGITKKVTIVK